MKVASLTLGLNEVDYLGAVLESLHLAGVHKNYVIINKFGFGHAAQDKGKTEEVAKRYGATIFTGDYGNEANSRNTFLQILQNDGYDYVLIVDADEIHVPFELKTLLADLERNPDKQYPAFLAGGMKTFFKYPNVQIEPAEPFKPLFLIRTDVRFKEIRDLGSHVGLVTLTDYPLYHFSYARQPEKIKEKITNFEHRNEILSGWFEEIFMKWTPEMRNLHPTDPSCYEKAVVTALPVALRELLAEHGSKWVKENLDFNG